MMDLQHFRRSAARKKGKLLAFLKKLDEVVPEDFSVLVQQAEKKVWEKVNCTECANCCKTMTPTFNPEDIKRIAKHLELKPKEFVTQYLYQEEDTKDWMNKAQPCSFLKNNKCSIYEVRPLDCAEFPHFDKKPFDAYNDTFSNNLDKCPATLALVDRLKKKVEKDYEW